LKRKKSSSVSNYALKKKKGKKIQGKIPSGKKKTSPPAKRNSEKTKNTRKKKGSVPGKSSESSNRKGLGTERRRAPGDWAILEKKKRRKRYRILVKGPQKKKKWGPQEEASKGILKKRGGVPITVKREAARGPSHDHQGKGKHRKQLRPRKIPSM